MRPFFKYKECLLYLIKCFLQNRMNGIEDLQSLFLHFLNVKIYFINLFHCAIKRGIQILLFRAY